MKKMIIALALALPLTAYAGDKHGGNHDEMAGRQMDMMARDLDLTDSQRDQISTIFDDHRNKMKALREETEAKVNDVLTPEQRAKAEKMRDKRREKWEERKEKWQEKGKHRDDMGGRPGY